MAANDGGNGSTAKEDMDKFQERILLEPYQYILQNPGKEVRVKLTQAFNYWMKIPNDKLEIVSEVTQMLHNASLLIDDIEDSSKLRRGNPVAHSIYGIPQTINTANYVYFLALQKIMALEIPEATKIYMEQLLILHQGQGMDIWWRDNFNCPTEEEYKEMVLKKTGGLFGLAVRLMQLFSTNKSNFKPLIDALGLFFQIRDDYANLQSSDYTDSKSFCEDLTEGKYSFPIIHGILSQPESTQVKNILRQRTTDFEVKKYCVEYLEKIGSFEYTRKIIAEYTELAKKQIQELGGNPYLESIVQELGSIICQSTQLPSKRKKENV
ncbi:geranylgeranyl pyrophosphate synthase-like isoform X1 [Apostichopus japonicus]|uniref:geranylgeranyl pyrophosphate synthase-like isoform X1 n=2 Tax=Stichopus japonicus TaxID=307972 RepID=UPI003AB6F132